MAWDRLSKAGSALLEKDGGVSERRRVRGASDQGEGSQDMSR